MMMISVELTRIAVEHSEILALEVLCWYRVLG